MNCANVAAECLDGSAGLAEGGSGFVVFSPLPRRRITSTKHIVQTLRVVSWLWCFKDMVGDASPASCQVKRSVIPGLSPSRRASSIPVGVNKKIAGNQSKHKQRPVRECSSCGSENLMWGAHKDGIWTAFYCKACRTGGKPQLWFGAQPRMDFNAVFAVNHETFLRVTRIVHGTLQVGTSMMHQTCFS